MATLILLVAAAVFVLLLLVTCLSWYRKCPSDKILVIFGKIRGQQASLCIHGGAKMVIPVLQDYGYIDLRPLQINVNLDNALCKQNIRISVPSVFTVGVSTDPALMGNAADRLLGLSPDAIADLAKDIIFGQLRLVIASMMIEEINADRESFLRSVEANVAEELKKLGLVLLNVNITDITDGSGYIEAIGQRAAAGAINQAKIDVAEETRKGSIGSAEASKNESIAVSKANAEAAAGVADAERNQRIAVSQANAKAAAGEADAERDKRIAVKQADAAATQGENLAAIEIAQSNAARGEAEAEAYRRAEAAKQIAQAQIEKARFEAEAEAQKSRAEMETERQRAEVIVPAEISKQQITIAAEAEAERLRREAQGEADAIYAKLAAEAKGNMEILAAKGEGYRKIIESCNSDATAASQMLLIEKLQEIVALQTEAIKNIKIDKITVWDGGSNANGKTSTANFLSGMVESLPPLHNVAKMAGLELPEYLGKVEEKSAVPDEDR
ncbi:MAG: flotillin family protein [Lentisphaeria bacterium]|nr:flotillin family protein [Lentisphaeria bacterium]